MTLKVFLSQHSFARALPFSKGQTTYLCVPIACGHPASHKQGWFIPTEALLQPWHRDGRGALPPDMRACWLSPGLLSLIPESCYGTRAPGCSPSCCPPTAHLHRDLPKAKQLPLQLARSRVCLASSAARSLDSPPQGGAERGNPRLSPFPWPLPAGCTLPAQPRSGSDPVPTHTSAPSRWMCLVLHWEELSPACPTPLQSLLPPRPARAPLQGLSLCPWAASRRALQGCVPAVPHRGCATVPGHPVPRALCKPEAGASPNQPLLGTAQFLLPAAPAPAQLQTNNQCNPQPGGYTSARAPRALQHHDSARDASLRPLAVPRGGRKGSPSAGSPLCRPSQPWPPSGSRCPLGATLRWPARPYPAGPRWQLTKLTLCSLTYGSIYSTLPRDQPKGAALAAASCCESAACGTKPLSKPLGSGQEPCCCCCQKQPRCQPKPPQKTAPLGYGNCAWHGAARPGCSAE